MDQETYSLRTEERDQCLILFLEGDITNACEQEVFDAYEKLQQDELKTIILDFEHVRYINSAGIAIFISLLTKIRNRKQELLISNLSEYFHKIFTMIGLTRYSTCYPSIDEAMTALKET